MPCVTLTQSELGPRIRFLVGPSDYRQAVTRPLRSALPIEVGGIVDTGSSRTLIDRNIVEILGLDPIAKVLFTPLGNQIRSVSTCSTLVWNLEPEASLGALLRYRFYRRISASRAFKHCWGGIFSTRRSFPIMGCKSDSICFSAARRLETIHSSVSRNCFGLNRVHIGIRVR